MIHYHGTPITPRLKLLELAGRHFCVSYAAPQDAATCLQIGQSVMFDNGAFSAWTRGVEPDWQGYYDWLRPNLAHPHWAVIPDVIDGDEAANDALLEQWPYGELGAPVWHMHESIGRLIGLASAWTRVCIGSSGEYRQVGSAAWHDRMTSAMNALCDGFPPVWLHGMRMMDLSDGIYPFASVDSTDVARNHNRPANGVKAMVERWDSIQPAGKWTKRPTQQSFS